MSDDIRDILQLVVENAKKQLKIKKIILFGSYAKNEFHPESDLDIAFFIENNSESMFDAFKKISKICLCSQYDVQPQIFYEQELAEPMGIVEEVLDNGIDITEL